MTFGADDGLWLEGPLDDFFHWPVNPNAPLAVEDECKHGRLPSDRTPPCGCWADLEFPRAA